MKGRENRRHSCSVWGESQPADITDVFEQVLCVCQKGSSVGDILNSVAALGETDWTF